MKRFFYFAVLMCACAGAQAQVSPYINKVYEYRPAPGQFINVLPTYEEGNTEADMIRKAEEKIVGQVGSSNYICLGAWGGYVTFGFDHPLVNVAGEYDFKIYGNAFLSGQPQDGKQFGSSEPGIIYVSEDTNGDGLPNDAWYEIAGSMADSAIYNYAIRYANAGLEDTPWEDNQGKSGYVYRNKFHQQPYFPQWINENRLDFSGTLLPPNIVQVEGGAAPRAYAFDYGYADNWPNDDERSSIKLDWAITPTGEPANLKYVHFIRVQTGVMVDWGVSGEMSTEVCGAEDLHPNAPLPIEDALESCSAIGREHKYLQNGQIIIERNGVHYTILGNTISK